MTRPHKHTPGLYAKAVCTCDSCDEEIVVAVEIDGDGEAVLRASTGSGRSPSQP